MVYLLKIPLFLIALVMVAATALCFFGGQYWWAEPVSHFTLQYLCIGLILALLCGIVRWPLLATMFVAVAVVQGGEMLYITKRFVQTPAINMEIGNELRVLQFNATRSNEETLEMAQALDAAIAEHDVVAIQAMPIDFEPSAAFTRAFPYHYVDKGYYGVFSKTPIVTQAIGGEAKTGGHLLVVLPNFQVQFITANSWFPSSQEDRLKRDEQHDLTFSLMSKMDMPTFLVGDLNITPYSLSLQHELARDNVWLAPLPRGLMPTWPRQLPTAFLRIPLDLLIVNNRVQVESRTLMDIPGSLHLAVSNKLRIMPYSAQ